MGSVDPPVVLRFLQRHFSSLTGSWMGTSFQTPEESQSFGGEVLQSRSPEAMANTRDTGGSSLTLAAMHVKGQCSNELETFETQVIAIPRNHGKVSDIIRMSAES